MWPRENDRPSVFRGVADGEYEVVTAMRMKDENGSSNRSSDAGSAAEVASDAVHAGALRRLFGVADHQDRDRTD